MTESLGTSPGSLLSGGRGLVFQLVYRFHRYWAYSSKSTVQPKMESCFQDGACSVCFLLHNDCSLFMYLKVTSLLLNVLSRLVITFLPRSKCLLISWMQSPSAVILEPRKIKSATVSTVSPSICHEVIGPDAMIFAF